MARRMSCSMTIDAVRDRTKTVTRRHPDTWKNLKPGDRLTLIEQGMGLPRGAKQVVLAQVVVVDVRVEAIDAVHTEPGATAAEGLPHMTAAEFITFWRRGHRRADVCRRIEWRYQEDHDG